MKTKYIWLLAIALGLTSCDSDDDNTAIINPLPELIAGEANFSNYVSIGASFTAGTTDQTLFIASQQNSFPNIISQQFAKIGGSEFTQPLVSDNIGGLVLGGTVIQPPRLYFDGAGPAVLPATPTTDASIVLSGPFHNMGVPGAKSFHLVTPGYGLLNPYFGRMASNPTATVMEDVLAQNPTFFTLSEIGGNDVLGYALSGGSGMDQTGNLDPSTYGNSDITDPTVFAQTFTAMVTALTANGAKGVVTTVPYVTSLSNFTTIPHNPLDPSNPEFGPQIPVLNATFAALNQAFAFLQMPERSIVFSENEASPVVIFDESLPNISAQLNAVLQGGGVDPLTAGLLSQQFGQSRQANANDLLLLASSSVIATLNEPYFNALVGQGVPAATAGQLAVNGVTYPLSDQWVLTPEELTAIATATDSYNATITSVASSNNLALVDLNAILTQASESGIQFDEFNMNTDLVFGGLVSLDGVHLTARGYALMANKFLEAIDSTYGSNFVASDNMARANDYPTNYSPQLQ